MILTRKKGAGKLLSRLPLENYIKSQLAMKHNDTIKRIRPGSPATEANRISITVHARAAPLLHSCSAISNPERGVKINIKTETRKELIRTGLLTEKEKGISWAGIDFSVLQAGSYQEGNK